MFKCCILDNILNKYFNLIEENIETIYYFYNYKYFIKFVMLRKVLISLSFFFFVRILYFLLYFIVV